MKKLKKIKLFLLAIIAIFVIVACDKDLYEEAINQDKEINIKQISLEKFNSKMRQMKNKPEIERFMVSSRNGSALSRTESTSEFEIITDDIKEITQGDYTSYTMYLKTPDTTNNIYNITIEEIDGNSSFFITKYIPKTYWLENKNLPFDGEIITYRESNTNSSGANTLQEYLDLIYGELYAAGGGGGGISGTGNSTSTSYPYDCNGIVYETTIVTEIKCGCGHNWQDLLTGVCDGCRDYLPTYPSLSTTTTYQCIPISSNPSGSGDTSGGNTLGGGGSGSGTGTGSGGTSTGAVTGSITTIVDPTEECNAPRGDLNNDCMLDENEANFVTFLDNLTPEERRLVNGDNNTKMNVFNYLVNQNWSNESEQFVNELLIYCTINNNSSESIEEINSILNLLRNDTPVIVGPDHPITNMSDYLSCFNTSQGAIVIIYADQPKANKHNIYSSNDGVGHAFFSIKQNNNIATLGFYPISSVGSLFGATPGIFGNDQNHTFDVSISTQISNTKLQELINLLTSINNPIYDLHQYNCTDVAMTIANLSNISILSCESPSPWAGDTPGTLGEIIRELPTPSNGSKNSNGGNAPFNNCN